VSASVVLAARAAACSEGSVLSKLALMHAEVVLVRAPCEAHSSCCSTISIRATLVVLLCMQADSAVRRQKAAQLDLQIVEGAEARKQLKKDLRAAYIANAELEVLCRSLQADRKAASASASASAAAAAAVKAADVSATAAADTSGVTAVDEQDTVGVTGEHTAAAADATESATNAAATAGDDMSGVDMNSIENSDNDSNAVAAGVSVNGSSDTEQAQVATADDATAGDTSTQDTAAVSDSSVYVAQHGATAQQQELDAIIADTIKTSSEILNSINTHTDTASDSNSSVNTVWQEQQQSDYNVDDAFSGNAAAGGTTATCDTSTEQLDDAESAALVNNMADFVLG
jgi:hypothetical protein